MARKKTRSLACPAETLGAGGYFNRLHNFRIKSRSIICSDERKCEFVREYARMRATCALIVQGGTFDGELNIHEKRLNVFTWNRSVQNNPTK